MTHSGFLSHDSQTNPWSSTHFHYKIQKKQVYHAQITLWMQYPFGKFRTGVGFFLHDLENR